MSTFQEAADVFKHINPKRIFREVLESDKLQEFIYDTVQNRVVKTGIAGDGTKLRTDAAESGEFYNAFTIIMKERSSGSGGITDHVTLYQSGKFWDSMRMTILDTSIKLYANFEKKDGNMYKNFTFQFGSAKEFEDAVLSLNQTELKKTLNNYVIPEFERKLNENF